MITMASVPSASDGGGGGGGQGQGDGNDQPGDLAARNDTIDDLAENMSLDASNLVRDVTLRTESGVQDEETDADVLIIGTGENSTACLASTGGNYQFE